MPLLVLDCTLSLPQCSSLMLIESTRDSLCFTVTHYKHSKQQYNIQVRVGRLGTDLSARLALLSLSVSLWKVEIIVDISQACVGELR